MPSNKEMISSNRHSGNVMVTGTGRNGTETPPTNTEGVRNTHRIEKCQATAGITPTNTINNTIPDISVAVSD